MRAGASAPAPGSFSLGERKFIQRRLVERADLTQISLRFLDVVQHGRAAVMSSRVFAGALKGRPEAFNGGFNKDGE